MCAQLGASCGTHGDGCGGTVSCGTRQTAVCEGRARAEQHEATSRYLGSSADTDSKTPRRRAVEARRRRGLVQDPRERSGFGGNPIDPRVDHRPEARGLGLPRVRLPRTTRTAAGRQCGRRTTRSATAAASRLGHAQHGLQRRQRGRLHVHPASARLLFRDGTCHSYDLRAGRSTEGGTKGRSPCRPRPPLSSQVPEIITTIGTRCAESFITRAPQFSPLPPPSPSFAVACAESPDLTRTRRCRRRRPDCADPTRPAARTKKASTATRASRSRWRWKTARSRSIRLARRRPARTRFVASTTTAAARSSLAVTARRRTRTVRRRRVTTQAPRVRNA